MKNTQCYTVFVAVNTADEASLIVCILAFSVCICAHEFVSRIGISCSHFKAGEATVLVVCLV